VGLLEGGGGVRLRATESTTQRLLRAILRVCVRVICCRKFEVDVDAGGRVCRAERGRLDDLTRRLDALRKQVGVTAPHAPRSGDALGGSSAVPQPGAGASGAESSPKAGADASKKRPPLTKDAVRMELSQSLDAALLTHCPTCGDTFASGLLDAHRAGCRGGVRLEADDGDDQASPLPGVRFVREQGRGGGRGKAFEGGAGGWVGGGGGGCRCVLRRLPSALPSCTRPEAASGLRPPPQCGVCAFEAAGSGPRRGGRSGRDDEYWLALVPCDLCGMRVERSRILQHQTTGRCKPGARSSEQGYFSSDNWWHRVEGAGVTVDEPEHVDARGTPALAQADDAASSQAGFPRPARSLRDLSGQGVGGAVGSAGGPAAGFASGSGAGSGGGAVFAVRDSRGRRGSTASAVLLAMSTPSEQVGPRPAQGGADVPSLAHTQRGDGGGPGPNQLGDLVGGAYEEGPEPSLGPGHVGQQPLDLSLYVAPQVRPDFVRRCLQCPLPKHKVPAMASLAVPAQAEFGLRACAPSLLQCLLVHSGGSCSAAASWARWAGLRGVGNTVSCEMVFGRRH
jgi:hypothetical protein